MRVSHHYPIVQGRTYHILAFGTDVLSVDVKVPRTARRPIWRGLKVDGPSAQRAIAAVRTSEENAVMDACEAKGAQPYIDEIRRLGAAWEEWLKNPEQFISEDMLESMSTLLELAGVELAEPDTFAIGERALNDLTEDDPCSG